mgnify:CR=1 FL=1
MLLLVQLITEVLQHVVPVTPVFFYFDKHFQENLLIKEAFDILTCHSTYLFQCLATMPDDDSFLGIAFNNNERFDMNQLGFFLSVSASFSK